ncbi:MAG: PP0621 family protein [Candidatus Binatia bacterium]
MSRLLVFLVLACVFFFLIRSFLSRRRDRAGSASRKQTDHAEVMVLDPQCQSYLPRREAIARGGRFFCSEKCARAFLER